MRLSGTVWCKCLSGIPTKQRADSCSQPRQPRSSINVSSALSFKQSWPTIDGTQNLTDGPSSPSCLSGLSRSHADDNRSAARAGYGRRLMRKSLSRVLRRCASH
ncbi:hypothetical protein EV356DRAFT_107294 [Viridothelium virens]|uniref:Uncharacterized protein n=1 Tax=Viridothelium virens TaxID=1048519 RepID=A0A6A6HNH7_VIRVR|nr:hypothetical protein EV356DRAFT_107294 [Viridothelium virens]